MTDKKLLENVSKLGVSLLSVEETVDVNQTLAAVVKSHDVRLWEHFPVLVANATKDHQLVLEKLKQQLNLKRDQKVLGELFALSKSVYDVYHINFSEFNKAAKSFKTEFVENSKPLESLRSAMKQVSVSVGDLKLSTQRVRAAFEDYLSRQNQESQKARAKHQDLSLEFALSQVFSPRQKELFNKKLNSEKFTKTEREYYSRTVKRKVQALANPDLHHLAQKLME